MLRRCGRSAPRRPRAGTACRPARRTRPRCTDSPRAVDSARSCRPSGASRARSPRGTGARPARCVGASRRTTTYRTHSAGLFVAGRRFRSGPPRGLFRIGWVRSFPTLNEFFVHHEDVRRANGCGPRATSPAMDALCGATWGTRRGSWPGDYAVSGSTAPGGHFVDRQSRRGEPTVCLIGPPGELLLYLFGPGCGASRDQ